MHQSTFWIYCRVVTDPYCTLLPAHQEHTHHMRIPATIPMIKIFAIYKNIYEEYKNIIVRYVPTQL